MSAPDPFGGGNPFEGMPFFGDLAKMMQQQGPVNWEAARQFALQVASGGVAEPNVDPVHRIKLEELVRVAELRVAHTTGLAVSTTGRAITVVPVTRTEWARRTLEGWRPFLERLATSLSAMGSGALPGTDDLPEGDPTAQLLGGIFQMIGPVMLGMQSGSMVGHLAQRSMGQYDLPLPRPASDELMVVHANLEAFAEEWSLPGDDLRLWVCLHELTHHAVLGVPHVRARLEGLVLDYVSGFRLEPDAFEHRLADLDPSDPQALQQVFGDPEAMLGAMQSPLQQALLPQLEAVVAVVVGYVDHVMDTAGTGLIGSYGMLTEALHRRRVEANQGDRFVEHLFGMELGRTQYERGSAFVQGVVERAGADALGRLWEAEELLPTPAEVDAPGLWLARIDL